jgi:hypothetical protein
MGASLISLIVCVNNNFAEPVRHIKGAVGGLSKSGARKSVKMIQ